MSKHQFSEQQLCAHDYEIISPMRVGAACRVVSLVWTGCGAIQFSDCGGQLNYGLPITEAGAWWSARDIGRRMRAEATR